MREVPRREFEPFSRIEILKAKRTVALAKSPGADKIPAEVYQRCPALAKVVAKLFASALEHDLAPEKL